MEKRLETILSLELPFRGTVKLQRSVFQGGSGPRVAVTAGIYGNELEGLYLCHRLVAWLEALGRTRPEALLGQVELYPGMNPLGLSALQRTVPVYDSDLDWRVPGYSEGPMPQRIAAAAMAYLQRAALVIDIHASDVYLWELPQVRIDSRFSDVLLPWGQRLNLDMIWIHKVISAFQTELASSLNAQGRACLLVVMGTGIGVTPCYSEQLLTGILTLWRDLGVLASDIEIPALRRPPLIINDDKVQCLNAGTSGLFVSKMAKQQGIDVVAGELLGEIVSPYEGRTLAEIRSPVSGLLFSLRQYSLVYEGSLLARIAHQSAAGNRA